MYKGKQSETNKIFGGVNFLVVLWLLLSLIQLGFTVNWEYKVITNDLLSALYIIGLIFLAMLNLFIGITSFHPFKRTRIWVLSIIVVVGSLLVLNSYQFKMEKVLAQRTRDVNTMRF